MNALVLKSHKLNNRSAIEQNLVLAVVTNKICFLSQFTVLI